MSQSVINEFRGEYAFLSNFFEAEEPIYYHFGIYLGIHQARTGEHLFQALKTLVDTERTSILAVPTPKQAKAAGRRVTMRPHWDQVRLAAMQEVLEAKFKNPDLAAKLIATGDAELVEGNYWNDTFWGVDLRSGTGQNWLGRLLMLKRAQLIARDGKADTA